MKFRFDFGYVVLLIAFIMTLFAISPTPASAKGVSLGKGVRTTGVYKIKPYHAKKPKKTRIYVAKVKRVILL